MAAFAGGRTLGVARNARMIHVQTPHELNRDWPIERFLEALINVANRCIGTKDTTVINMSWGLQFDSANIGVWEIMGKKFIYLCIGECDWVRGCTLITYTSRRVTLEGIGRQVWHHSRYRGR